MFSTEVCKKITYAMEQTASARWNHGEEATGSLAEALDEAMSALRAALIEAANAE